MFVFQRTQSILTDCFEKADEGNFTSVALPINLTTSISYAEDVFINAMCASLNHFNSRYKSSTLQIVKIVCEDGLLDISKV